MTSEDMLHAVYLSAKAFANDTGSEPSLDAAIRTALDAGVKSAQVSRAERRGLSDGAEEPGDQGF